MSQSMSQVISQVLRQEQRLTPQLIQSMDILQLPLTALETRINEEMEQNPVLEYVRPTGEAQAPAETPQQTSDETPRNDDPIESIEAMVDRSRFGSDGYESRPRGSFVAYGEIDPKIEALANTAARPVSLQEYLQQQWRLVEATPEIKRAGEAIVGFIEEDGYLRTNFETVSAAVRPTLERAQLDEALRLVQKMEPPGVGGGIFMNASCCSWMPCILSRTWPSRSSGRTCWTSRENACP